MSLWFQQLWLVMLGGALGAAGRYWLGGVMLRQLGAGFPWGTLAANLLGAFAGGFLAVWLEGRGASALYWRAFLVVGLLGGFTTYSALMIECLLYSRSSRSELAIVYLLLTLFLGLLLVWGGARLGHMLRP
ncbi:fluoride efflux transporter CrcB [Lysobacter solisilvae (ex Woo and Kim 2020)]|uniref:Fluoride-specific ion channel FluC n=1 Tax=Agrilutibacter terrestris TaxID=2865112 RepID=A0A7H0FXF2_9GAMM|nr:fluoride efflux transporter CrcB [Lysobacter terrestris]QNP40718.1 fluoride efflux transporter CrcB [Lysobacter terrestris]